MASRSLVWAYCQVCMERTVWEAWVKAAIEAALEAANAAAENGSPSKRFAREIGVPISQGIAVGIREASPDVQQAVASTIVTKNYNLTVNTNANVEPVVSDFNMIAAWAQAREKEINKPRTALSTARHEPHELHEQGKKKDEG